MNDRDLNNISNEEIIKDIHNTLEEIKILNKKILDRYCFINRLKFLLMIRRYDKIEEIMKL